MNMVTKRRLINNNASSGLKFRPNPSDANVEQRGTKPTSDPTSIKEILTLMVLFACKKSLFYDTNLKVGLYLAILFLLSLIGDVASVPKFYLSRSGNIFNQYFVKLAWGWNLTLLVPFVVLTSFIYCCGQRSKIIRHHLTRLVVATFFWWISTKTFNFVEATFGRCQNRGFSSRPLCLEAGHLWNGFDISGHTFILIYGSLVLIEETRCMVNWDSIKDYIRLEEHYRITKETTQSTNPLRYLTNDEFVKLQTNYAKYTPYIRGLFILITLFQIMWDVLLVVTLLYYHIMVEKFLGGAIAIMIWFFTYRVWYVYPKVIPNLPGDGVFKYIKPKTSNNVPTATRRRTGSLVGNNLGPTFMGRPLYPQQQENQREENNK